MSETRTYSSMMRDLLKALGIDDREAEQIRSVESAKGAIQAQKCLYCCWGKPEGGVIFCPFTKCMKNDPVFEGLNYDGRDAE